MNKKIINLENKNKKFIDELKNIKINLNDKIKDLENKNKKLIDEINELKIYKLKETI